MKPLSECRILVVGQLDYGSTSRWRLDALRSIALQVEHVATIPITRDIPIWMRVLTEHFCAGPIVRRINLEIESKAKRFRPDLVWIDKGLLARPETLKAIKRTPVLLIHYSGDNQMLRGNQSPYYLKGIPCYDVHITTKKHNIGWLLRRGARRVEYMGNGFNPDIHKPMNLTAEETARFGCDVGFVGHWEPNREELLSYLWERGYSMKVWGGSWENAKRRNHPLFRNARFLVGTDYVRALCGAKINLCLVSQRFGDKTTDRSVEIPACGKFMLAERNDEHLSFFKEGVEAEFYGTREELVEKVDYYLMHGDKREAIAKAGHERCLRGYSNQDRLIGVLSRALC